jgi:hypothetical protein
MHLSIWQQFSSNHSADFTVIGQFETPEQAEAALARIRTIWLQIYQWREANFSSQDLWSAYWQGAIGASPEQEFAQEVGIPWHPDYKLEWIRRSSDVENTVRLFRNLVILSSDGETWHYPETYIAYLRQSNANVFVSYMEYSTRPNTVIIIRLSATAPTETLAQQIQSQINQHLLLEQPVSTPWVAFSGGKRHPLTDRYDFVLNRPLPDVDLTADEKKMIWIDNMQCWAYSPNPDGIVRRDHKLEINQLVFTSAECGFPAFITWLESFGCTVTYSFANLKETEL